MRASVARTHGRACGRDLAAAHLQTAMKIVAGCSRHSFNAWIIAAAS
jgi:hypothetical protein